MAWDIELVGLLRALIYDFDSARYSDSRLQQVIVAVAQIVKTDAAGRFLNNYSINYTAQTISPDPTSTSVRDDDFISLVILRAACLVDNGEARDKARKSFSVKEFSSSIDNKDAAKYLMNLWEKGYCKEYDDRLFHYLNGNGSVGQIVLGPIRSYLNYRSGSRR